MRPIVTRGLGVTYCCPDDVQFLLILSLCPDVPLSSYRFEMFSGSPLLLLPDLVMDEVLKNLDMNSL